MNTEIQEHYKSFFNHLCVTQRPEFAVTITLKRLYVDDISLRTFDFFMRSVQKPIRSNLNHRGYAFVERTWKQARFEGQLHMHSVIWGVRESTRDPEAYLRSLVERSALRLKDDQGRQMADMSTICVQTIHASDGLISYDTKDMLRWSPDRRTRVYAITPSGLDVSCQLNGSADKLQRDDRWRPKKLTTEELVALC